MYDKSAHFVAEALQIQDEEQKALVVKLFDALLDGNLTLEASDEKSYQGEIPFVKQVGDHLFFENYYELVCRFKREVERLKNASVEKVVDLPPQDPALTDEQQAAVKKATQSPLLILTGGPGTGKTYTAAKILESLTKNQELHLALAAPTGKAAKNLEESLRKSGLDTKAVTLHRLLSAQLQSREIRALPHDVVLVDEASMIDVEMMVTLLSSVKSGARLILLGDPYQLPPVEAGSLFTDLLEMVEGSCTAKLTRCLRAEFQEIVDLARAIQEKNGDEMVRLLRESDPKRLSWKTFSSRPHTLVKELTELAIDKWSFLKDLSLNVEEVTRALKTVALLTPLNRGLFGVDHLNHLIAEAFPYPLTPVLVTKNDPELQLFNGDVGLRHGKEVFFVSDQTLRTLPAVLIEGLKPAFCLSIHKSQGSEYNEILLLLPDGAEHLTNELLYTGVTRSKQKITLYSNEETLLNALSQTTSRHSGWQVV